MNNFNFLLFYSPKTRIQARILCPRILCPCAEAAQHSLFYGQVKIVTNVKRSQVKLFYFSFLTLLVSSPINGSFLEVVTVSLVLVSNAAPTPQRTAVSGLFFRSIHVLLLLLMRTIFHQSPQSERLE